MTEFGSREGSPLTDAEWQVIDEAVINAARAALVGRRFLPLVGPFGSGMTSVPVERVRRDTTALTSLTGDRAGGPVAGTERRELPVPVLACDFRLEWRDLERARRQELPLDTGRPAAAALEVATAEDRLIFFGDTELGIPGLMNAPGRARVDGVDWKQPGQGYQAVLAGVQKLMANGYPGPFTLVLGPDAFAHLNRVLEGTPLLELDRVAKLVRGEMLVSPLLGDSALLIWPQPQVADLVVGQDVLTLYLESSGLVHYFRVMESIVPRIKTPEAICTIEGA
ncbi:MAG: bacteriocin family protein [Firmicutes bacterium]|nr:bacteriocin family protein [Candidatus Fermentithermobacillaceae bacterium]